MAEFHPMATDSPSLGFISTYPPTQCGLATFAASLRGAMLMADDQRDIGVLNVVDGPPLGPIRPEVVGSLRPGSAQSRADAIKTLGRYDAVIMQHEFGIFGGPDGNEIVEVLESLKIPKVVVLHTVLDHPTPGQRRTLEAVGAHADRLVTMSEAAQSRLERCYNVDPDRLLTIPHGARAGIPRTTPAGDFQTVLTWGLLSDGKGIELVIKAMAGLSDLPVRYVVCGQTHPKVAAREGQRYRRSLLELAASLDLTDTVVFDDGYHDTDSLARVIAEADVVVLPYRSRDQVTSGVLVEAIAAGKPVVATGFPHATELLAAGSGLVVAHDDPAALTLALRAVLTNPEMAQRMTQAALTQAHSLMWSSVAARYDAVIADLALARSALAS